MKIKNIKIDMDKNELVTLKLIAKFINRSKEFEKDVYISKIDKKDITELCNQIESLSF